MKQATTFEQFKLPLMILGAFLLAALWVGMGRILFGVFGWMAFITLFFMAPIVVVYGIILAIVAAVRQQHHMYRQRGPFKLWLLITLVALFCVGFFMPDAGDTKDSGASALSVLLMDRTSPDLIGLSGVLAGWAVFFAVVAAVVTMVMAVAERSKPSKKPES